MLLWYIRGASGSSCFDRMTVSSTNIDTTVSFKAVRAGTKIVHNMGPRILHCRIPSSIVHNVEFLTPILVLHRDKFFYIQFDNYICQRSKLVPLFNFNFFRKEFSNILILNTQHGTLLA